MAATLSAGILLYRRAGPAIEVLLVHPGGPFWRNKDQGAWMVPKGGVEPGEEPADAALREFEEELGTRPTGFLRPLARIRQKGGKWVEAFAMEGDFDCADLKSNEFEVELPPRSGKFRSFPEVDEARWFPLADAEDSILPSQRPLLAALQEMLRKPPPAAP